MPNSLLLFLTRGNYIRYPDTGRLCVLSNNWLEGRFSWWLEENEVLNSGNPSSACEDLGHWIGI